MKIGIETKELSQILEQLHVQEDQLSDLRDQLETEDRVQNRKDCTIRDLNEKIRDLEIERDQYQQSIQGLQKKILELESDKRILEDTLLDNVRVMNFLRENNQELGAERNTLRTELEKEITRNSDLVNEMQQLKAANQELRQALELERLR